MWLFIRLLAVVIAFIARCFRHFYPPAIAGYHNKKPYFEFIKTNRQDEPTLFRIGMPFVKNLHFSFHKETRVDKIFKGAGFVAEYQLGDFAFDSSIYIACDHPSLLQFLQTNEHVRQEILAIFESGYSCLYSNGEALFLEKKTNQLPNAQDLDTIAKLVIAFEAISLENSHYKDRFYQRAIAIEALTWSIAAYAFIAFIEYRMHSEDYHLDGFSLLMPGIMATIGLFVLIFTLIVLLLRHSSRAHRILVESALLLSISLPIAGIELVSDINREFDNQKTTVLDIPVHHVEKHKHRSRRSTWYTYHIVLEKHDHRVGGVFVPQTIEVDKRVYQQADQSNVLAELEIAGGRLDLPWYKSIRIKNRVSETSTVY